VTDLDRPSDAQRGGESLEEPCFAILRRRSGGSDLILGLWEDGWLVWSADPIFGGPPLLERRILGERLDPLLHCIDRLFSRAGGDSIAYHAPRAGHVELYTSIGGRPRRLVSWHESFERNSGFVVTERGVEALEGRPRAQVAAGADSAYRRFRVLWRDLRAVATGLTAAGGRPWSGEGASPPMPAAPIVRSTTSGDPRDDQKGVIRADAGIPGP